MGGPGLGRGEIEGLTLAGHFRHREIIFWLEDVFQYHEEEDEAADLFG